MIPIRQKILNKLYLLCLSLFSNKRDSGRAGTLKARLKERVAGIYIELTNSTNEWQKNQLELKELICTGEIDNFLNWEIIKKTMFTNCNYEEFKSLYSSQHWKLIKKGLVEDTVGAPKKFHSFPYSSGNLLHHGYSLLQLLNFIGNDEFNKIGSVFEFGGGYGSFCRMMVRVNAGIKQYTIYDFEIFRCLQEYFLTAIGLKLPVNSENLVEDSPGVYLISGNLDIMANQDLFVALWSLSECPLELRKKITVLIAKSKYALLAYQREFGGIDNIGFFNELHRNLPQFNWKNYESRELPGNYYLIGQRK